MSAIWGLIGDLQKDKHMLINNKFCKEYQKYVIDKFVTKEDDSVSMGCGIQFFTPEAKNEMLPIMDSKKNIYFTADVVLDNREELLNKLGKNPKDNTVPDGQILYEMFDKYREDCLNDLLGAYAFVYYDKFKKECYLVADATGKRALQYAVVDGKIYFSTLINPLLKVLENKELNDTWLIDFLTLDNLALATRFDTTPYKNIMRVPAANYVKITNGTKIEQKCYWHPIASNLKLKSDVEYKELFQNTFQESVRCLMRNKVVPAFLSGGLDSSSTVCYAGEIARETGQKIVTYTSIPEKDYTSNLHSYYMTDESEAVIKTRDYLKERGVDIECKFIKLEDKNSWDERNDLLEYIEIPYKAMQNILWKKEGMEQAYKLDGRIILEGSFGNVTISANMTNVYLYECARKLHWIAFAKECYKTGKRNGKGKKDTFLLACQIFKESFSGEKAYSFDKTVGKSYVNRDTMKKLDTARRFEENHEWITKSYFDSLGTKQGMWNELLFYQIGELSTKHSLKTGVLQRDPTMDKRIIELCMSFPINQYVRDGISRRLVRVLLADKIPEHITNNIRYGLQGADAILKIEKSGSRIYSEMKSIFERNINSKYVDSKIALESLEQWEKNKNKVNALNNFELFRLEYTAMLLEFIESKS